MNRKEQIHEAAKAARQASAEALTKFGSQHYIDDVVALTDMKLSYDEIAEAAFEKGAEWADANPIQYKGKFVEFYYYPNFRNANKTFDERYQMEIITLNNRYITLISPYVLLGEECSLIGLQGGESILVKHSYEQVKAKLR